jgi:hypothetical protein
MTWRGVCEIPIITGIVHLEMGVIGRVGWAVVMRGRMETISGLSDAGGDSNQTSVDIGIEIY